MSESWIHPEGHISARAAVLLVVGTGAVCLLGAFGGALGFHWLKRAERATEAGGRLVPATVAGQDIAPSTALSPEMISERMVPEHSVTDSIVRPAGAAFVVGQKLTVLVRAGDMLSWSQFEVPKARRCEWIEQAARDCAESRRGADVSGQRDAPLASGSEQPGKLVTGSRPTAKLLVDGQDSGRWTPIPPAQALDLPPGEHLLTYVAGDGRRTTRRVAITSGETAKVTGVEDFQ